MLTRASVTRRSGEMFEGYFSGVPGPCHETAGAIWMLGQESDLRMNPALHCTMEYCQTVRLGELTRTRLMMIPCFPLYLNYSELKEEKIMFKIIPFIFAISISHITFSFSSSQYF